MIVCDISENALQNGIIRQPQTMNIHKKGTMHKYLLQNMTFVLFVSAVRQNTNTLMTTKTQNWTMTVEKKNPNNFVVSFDLTEKKSLLHQGKTEKSRFVCFFGTFNSFC